MKRKYWAEIRPSPTDSVRSGVQSFSPPDSRMDLLSNSSASIGENPALYIDILEEKLQKRQKAYIVLRKYNIELQNDNIDLVTKLEAAETELKQSKINLNTVEGKLANLQASDTNQSDFQY